MSKRFGLPLDPGIVAGGATVRALSEAVRERMAARNGQVPGLGVEEAIEEIWKSSLGVDSVGLDDDFFDLGGTSLALINVVVEMSKRFGLTLHPGIVTGGATVRALSEAVRERMAARNGQSPGLGVEEAVEEIWKSSLGVDSVELEDDFFDLGGTSLALINVVVAMSKRFGLPLDPGIVVGGATVRALSDAVRERMVGGFAPAIQYSVA
jgi:Syringomycin synthetase protein SyrB1